MGSSTIPPGPPAALPRSGRLLVLAVAFLGWLCAGIHMSITQQTGQAAAIDLLDRTDELDATTYQAWNKLLPGPGGPASLPPGLSAEDRARFREWKARVQRWFAWYQCAFLFGAAAGGLVFGWLGDRVGRARGMALSILTYSALAGAAACARSPLELVALWFLACTGVGGMWPNGVALVAEAWSDVSRPVMAGVIGTSANVGLYLFATVAAHVPIVPGDWRWAMLVGAAPLPLGLFALLAVPESPRWLAARRRPAAGGPALPSAGEVFRPPVLAVTVVGIVLATVPMIGGWGSANWMVPWAGEAGEAARPPDPFLKARVGQARALTGIAGSLLGGWIASVVGRRLTFFLVSLFSLLIAQYAFWFAYPTDPGFLLWVAALGFFSGIYFGWLPLCLPEYFPTRVRSTGSGVSFNFGRVITAATVFATGALTRFFGDYAVLGRWTSLIFVLGMLAIWFAPDTGRKQLEG